MRATTEVLHLAMQYCQASDPKSRARGLDVLAQLGAGKAESERPYLDECVSMAIAKLTDESPMVVNSAAWALAHLATPRAALSLLELKGHADPDVRHAVAYGMGLCPGTESTRVLIELMEDPSNVVRDWATCGLGTLSDADGTDVREALRKRLDDSFEDARDEALWGLVRRKDPAAVRTLLGRLEADTWVNGDQCAAADALGLSTIAPAEEVQVGLRRLLGD